MLVSSASNMPNTYVDPIDTVKLAKKPGKKYVAVFHGSLSKPTAWPGCAKDLKPIMRQRILDLVKKAGMVPVVLGNGKDRARFWFNIDMKGCEDYVGKLSLPDSVSILRQCDGFISNDTGLYHVAGALKKRGLVLWVKTDPVKNRSTFKGIKHVINKKADVLYFAKKVEEYLRDI